MNNWELCPKCKGNKTMNKYGIDMLCDICDGKGIISSLTGLPPKSQKSNWGNVDFSREVEDLIHK